MGIFRGVGGVGDADTDAFASEVNEDALTAEQKANEAAASAAQAAASATQAASSASSASSDAAEAAASISTVISAKDAAEDARDTAIAAKDTAVSAQAATATSETNAAASAASSSSSATAAAASETSAAASATSATVSANTATTKATEAATSATNALASANAAANSATEAATVVQGIQDDVTQSAANAAAAQAAADNAIDLEAQAAASAANALNSATAAAGSATSASASAATATTKATQSASSATAALASEAAAASSETASAASEAAAAASVTAATTQATNAATSASQAATSASNSADSATLAAASEAAAASSETNAANSATDASGSQTAAASSAAAALASQQAAATSASSAATSASSATTSATSAASSAATATSAKDTAVAAQTSASSSASAAASSATSAASSALAADQSAQDAQDIVDGLGVVATVTAGDISNWDSAYSWGDHSLAGYADSTSVQNQIDAVVATLNTSNWDTAYSWGNHASAGYLTSFTETDPVFSASAAAGISSGEISNWNTAYSWGNHATAGYQSASTAITTSNIGSQSVSYASSAGNANTLDGLDSSAFLRDDGWNTSPGQDANTQTGMRSDFTYSNNAPWTGELIRFGASGYSIQINAPYSSGSGNQMSFRTRNGDTSTWNPWRKIWNDGNDGSGSGLDADLLDGQHASAFAPASHSHNYVSEGGTSFSGTYPVVVRVGANNFYSNGNITFNGTTNGLTVGGRVDAPYFYDSTNTAYGFGEDGNNWKFTTPSGYVTIGPENSSWSHFYTDRPGFYMGTKLHVNGEIRTYGGNAYLNSHYLYGYVFYDSNNTGYYIDPASGGKVAGTWDFTNGNIYNVNHITINDPGPGEGIAWNGGNGWAIYESPDDLTTNGAGNLQFVTGSNRNFTVDTGGGGYFRGNLTVGGTNNSSNIYMNDNDHGQRIIHCNSNRIGFLTQSGSWGAWLDDGTTWFADGAMQSPIYYDINNTGYYADPASTSVFNDFRCDIMYDKDNTSYYARPGSTSMFNDLRGNIIYDRENTAYYFGSSHGDFRFRNGTVDAFTANGNITANSDIYGRSVNAAYSNLYRFGGIYFTWDSDSYGTNFEHSITSSDGGSYGDHITINSYGNIRFNFDSNNNGTNYMYWGHATTGTGNVLMYLDESGNLISSTGSHRAPIFYDQNNTGYYVDPAGTTQLSTLDCNGRIYADNGCHIRGDWLRVNGSNGVYFESYGGGWFMQDSSWVRAYNGKAIWSSNTIQSDSNVRAPIFYDTNNTGYYADPASTSNFNALNVVSGNIVPTASMSGSGYWKCNKTGLIIQWGNKYVGNNGSDYFSTWTFPLAFPNACWNVYVTLYNTTGNSFDASSAITSQTTTSAGFTVQEWSNQYQAITARFIAIGY